MKAFKKLICIVCALVLIMLSVVPSLAVDISELTYLYLDKGNIVIGDGTVSGYGYFGEYIDTCNENGYCITVSKKTIESVSNTVVVNGGENHITIKNLNIYVDTIDYACAFSVQGGAKLDLFFTGTNNLISSSARAGLEISSDSEVVIGGDGTLKAGSNGEAGIGGGSGGSNGSITINSGTITAICGQNNSAGIGGGSSGNGGNITINGGNIIAKAGRYAAGIGGGSSGHGGNITINGGTITATGGDYAAGIGGGWYGQMGNVVINGGSVKAVAGDSATAVGAGYGLESTDGPVNSDGKRVYPAKFSSSFLGTYTSFLVNNKEYSVCGNHPDDGNYYFYVPTGSCFVAVESSNAAPLIYKLSVTTSGSSSVSAVNPVRATNGASIGTDSIIRGISCGLTNLNNYLIITSGYSLSYDNEYIGTGTYVTVMFGNTQVYSYRALLYGDVNNDGFYDAEDSIIVLCILCNLLNTNNTDSIIFEAADADRNGTISEDDVLLLEQAGILKSEVTQNDTSYSSDSYLSEEYILLIDQSSKAVYLSDDNNIIDVQDEIITDSTFSFIECLKAFIKIAVKFVSNFSSFWKIYFI